MKNIVFLSLFFALFMLGCGNNTTQVNPNDSTTEFEVSKDSVNESKTKTNEQNDETEFLAFVKAFVKTVHTYKDLYKYTEKNEYLVLDNPGAFYILSWQNEKTEPGYALSNWQFMTNFIPVTGDMPQYSCETEAWSVEGCVLSQSQEDFITSHVTALEDLLEVPKTQTMLFHKRAKELAGQTTYIIYDTDATTGFYFSKKDNWIPYLNQKIF